MKILLIVYDNESFISPFPQGLAYIANVIEKEGYEVEIYNQDMYHYSEAHLTEYLNNNEFDVVGLNIIAGYYQYEKLLKISKAINEADAKPIYILGGHGVSAEPTYFLNKTKADIIVMGEGEETIIELLNGMTSSVEDIKKIKGIAYKVDDTIQINERRDSIKDIDSLTPAYHLFPIEFYRLQRYVHTQNTDFIMPVLSGRGCPYHCTFCYRMDNGFRARKAESVINEIRYLQKEYRINVIDFSDELLMSSVTRTEEFCNAIIKAELGIRWHCNGRLNFANKELLQLMRKAGCIFINYGIEALNDKVLKNMKKGLTVKIIEEGVKNTLEVGMSPGLNIMWGNIGDTYSTLNKAVRFLLKYDDCAQLRTIRPVTPYPGSELYYYAIEKGLLKDCEDFYENKHSNSDLVSINFTGMSNHFIHQVLLEANTKIIKNYYKKHSEYMIAQAKELYENKNVKFRGYRQF